MALDIAPFVSNPVFLGIVFILFVLAIKRVTKILMTCAWITAAAVLFPIIANKVFGLAVPVDTDSIIFFVTVGLGGYFLFLFASSLYRVLAFAEKEAEPVTGFLGRTFRGASQKMREGAAQRRLADAEKNRQKEELRTQKEKKRAEAERRRIEEEKLRAEEARLGEIERKASMRHSFSSHVKKDDFHDYLVIRDENAETEEKEESEEKPKRIPIRKKKKSRLIDKFKEADN